MRKKILVKGPVLTRSGYGEQSRFLLRSLRSREDLFDIYIQPIDWGKTSWLPEYDEERNWIDFRIKETIAYIQSQNPFDISVQVTIPNEFQVLAPINIGYTAGIETNKISHEWIQHTNQMDKVIVVSNHSKKIFETTTYEATHNQTNQPLVLKTEKPVVAVNYPVKQYQSLPEIELDLKNDFNFLCVAQMGPRKNIFNTIQWFVQEFHDDEVGLVLKTNKARNCLIDREYIFQDLVGFLNTKFPDRKCSVYLLHGDMTDEEMHSLYNHSNISAFVCLSHGEGFGLPFFEAAYTGIPVVAPGYSGQNDFLFGETGKENFYNVSFDMAPIPEEVVWDKILIKDSMWAVPREQSAKEMMRQCYEDVQNNTGIAANSIQYSTELRERFNAEKMYAQMVDAIVDKESVEKMQADIDQLLEDLL